MRHYGLLHPANRAKLRRLQEELNLSVESDTETEDKEIAKAITHTSSLRCPCCHIGYMVLVSILSPKRRGPP
nr:hypothetical protein [Deltaproteobacteria bacterium]